MRYEIITEFIRSNNYEDIANKEQVSIDKREFASKEEAKKFFETILYEDSVDNVLTYALFNDNEGDIICEIGIPSKCFQE